MGIIFRFVLRNIKEKKFRTFLILFSITMSAALFFAADAMSGSVEKIVVDRIRKAVGSAEILITANEKSPSRSMSMAFAQRLGDKLEYVAGTIHGSGIYKVGRDESIRIDLHGFDMEELQQMNPVALTAEQKLYPFNGKKIIISQNTAKKYRLAPGNVLDIEIDRQKHRFTVSGIAKPAGIFQEDGQSTNAIIPRAFLAGLYDMEGQVTAIYAKPKDLAEKQALIEQLSKIYNRYSVREAIPEEDIKRNASTFTVPFMMMVVLVLFISVFIIYTSFRVITTEMLPVIGTFRSIGATKTMTDMVLLAESMTYGIIGGALGCGLGIGMLYIMANMLLTPADKAAGFAAQISYSPVQLATAFILAVVLSVISSLVPIIKVSKISVKDIVLNKIDTTKKRRKWKLAAGILLFATVLLLPQYMPRKIAVTFDMFCMVFASISIVLLIPYLTAGFIKIFEKAYIFIFGNEGTLAVKNLRDNKNILNNISLLAMGISALLLINTISFSVFKEVANAYRGYHYAVRFYIDEADREKLGKVERVEGVDAVYGNMYVHDIGVGDGKDRIMLLYGADRVKFNDYIDVGILGDANALVDELSQSRSIIISNALKYKFGVEIGDKLVLNTKTGDREYRVIGFCETLFQNGQTAVIGDRFLKSDWKLKYISEVLVKTDEDPEVLKERIKESFKDQQLYIQTVAGMERENNEANTALFGIFRIFSIMTMVIGVFGILNNFAISFMERKRGLAMMRANGMSKGQSIKMIFIEALTGGLIGGAVGILTGILLISVIPYLLKAIDMPIPVHYSGLLFAQGLIGGTVVTLIASLSPAMKSSKLNIMEAIKYE